MRSPPAGQMQTGPGAFVTRFPIVPGSLPTITTSAIHGNMRTLTAEPRHYGIQLSLLKRCIFPPFRLQSQSVPDHRFFRQQQRDQCFPGFAIHVQARRNTPPNQVRHPTDRQFASGCSPPSLATTQLPSATGSWHTLTRTLTVLVQLLYRRTHDALRARRQDQNPGG